MLWNVKFEAHEADCPLELVTVTVAGPELCSGVTATIVEELLSVTEAAPSPPKVTDIPA
jgi:hypothetical protein